MKTLAALAFVLVCTTAFAQDAPKVKARARLEPAGPVVAGQQVKLIVDVLVTTWFTAAPQLPPLRLTGAIAQLSDEQLPHLNETTDGVHWSGVSRLYTITAQTGGELAIPSLAIRVQAGQSKSTTTVSTSPMKLVVKGAPGAQAAPTATKANASGNQVNNLPASTALTVTQQVDRDLHGLKVGDAFTRSVRITAQGTMAMFLPPTALATVPGLTAYPKAPVVENITTERGGFVAGERIDAATYVVQTPGHYELPAITVRWWDTKANKQRTVSLPPLTFDAAANPDHKPAFALPTEPAAGIEKKAPFDRRRVLLGVTVLIVLAVARWFAHPMLVRTLNGLRARIRVRRQQRAASEAVAFHALEAAARSGNRSGLLPLVYRWLDKLPSPSRPQRLDTLAAATGDPTLIRNTGMLLQAAYGTVSDTAPSADLRTAGWRTLRRRCLAPVHAVSARHDNLPASLNP